jgi:UDP-glucose 4-epimerase
MRFIVTGGAGFIGSNLVDALVELGDVTIIDDLSSRNLDNLEQLLKRDDVSLERLSVTDLEGMKPHFEDVNCVFHLAAVSNISSSVADPLRTNEVNVKGTLNVLLAARDSGVRKVVFASSASVYGDTEEVPTAENALPDPLSPYAVTKLAGEHYCDVFSELYGLETTSLRPFNVYGPLHPFPARRGGADDRWGRRADKRLHLRQGRGQGLHSSLGSQSEGRLQHRRWERHID